MFGHESLLSYFREFLNRETHRIGQIRFPNMDNQDSPILDNHDFLMLDNHDFLIVDNQEFATLDNHYFPRYLIIPSS